jgi:hypothetical protein
MLRSAPKLFPTKSFLCIIPPYRGNPVIFNRLGIHMRKATLLAAATFAAALLTMPNIANAAAAKKADPAMAAQQTTAKFMHDATVPYSVTAKAAAAPKAAKGKKKKK